MKEIRYLVAPMSIMVLISLFALSSLVAAQPPVPPHRFFGHVTFDWVSAPAGTEVTVRLDNGQIVATVYTGVYDGDNYYDMCEENSIPGTYEGQTVYFYVNSVDTGENREVVSGGSDRVDLTVDDEIGPIIENLRPVGNSTVTTGRPTISASYSDALSGIDVSTATMKVDGSTVSSARTATRISYIPATALPDGTHSVEVSVRDRVGNPSTESWSFTVSIAPEKATLIVDTNPIKGEVFVNGTSWGTAPQSRSVDPGTYTVSFGDVLGYVTPASQSVTVAENETKTVTGVYISPGKAVLKVDTAPVKGEVFVDGSSWGIAPQTREIDPGTYTVSFGEVSGHETPASQSVTVAENEMKTVTGVYTEIPTVVKNPFPWALMVGIITASVVVVATVIALSRRGH